MKRWMQFWRGGIAVALLGLAIVVACERPVSMAPSAFLLYGVPHGLPISGPAPVFPSLTDVVSAPAVTTTGNPTRYFKFYTTSYGLQTFTHPHTGYPGCGFNCLNGDYVQAYGPYGNHTPSYVMCIHDTPTSCAGGGSGFVFPCGEIGQVDAWIGQRLLAVRPYCVIGDATNPKQISVMKPPRDEVLRLTIEDATLMFWDREPDGTPRWWLWDGTQPPDTINNIYSSSQLLVDTRGTIQLNP